MCVRVYGLWKLLNDGVVRSARVPGRSLVPTSRGVGSEI